jgi:hypothetical protein
MRHAVLFGLVEEKASNRKSVQLKPHHWKGASLLGRCLSCERAIVAGLSFHATGGAAWNQFPNLHRLTDFPKLPGVP